MLTRFSFGPVLVCLGLLFACQPAASSPTPIAGSSATLLAEGPLVGAVTENSATVWVRTTEPAQVSVSYGTPQKTVSASTDAGSDFTTKLQMTQLTPRTRYDYAVSVNGAPQAKGTFTTFPERTDISPFQFVVLTDFRTVSKVTQNVDSFKKAAQENPAFVIIGGDFDHRNPTTLEEKRQMFRDLYTPENGMQDFANLILPNFPLAHFWDDHDYGDNNADKTYPHKADSLRVLDEYFPTYPHSQYGDWQQFSYGDADFFLLDSRSERDPVHTADGPNKSMLDGDHLGSAGQKEWLLNGLKNSTARWKFILSPVIFNPTAKWNDSWGGYPDERKMLIDFIRTNQIQGVIVLSGDLHAGGIDDGTNSGLTEMVIPAVNDGFDRRCITGGTGNIGKWSAGTYGDTSGNPCNGYGVIQVSPDAVQLLVKDSEGNTKIQYQVKQ